MTVTAEEQPVSDVVPKELESYFRLDLSPTGEIAKDLMARVSRESSLTEVALESIVGENPSDVTPETSSWYQSNIRPARSRALQALRGLFEARAELANGNGFLPQARQAQIDEDLLSSKLRCYQNQREKFQTTAQRISWLKADVAQKQKEYNVLRAELGREAKPLNRTVYLGVLVIVLFGSEAMINLQAFKSLPWASPAIAWGAAILIGLAIGLAAHFHGTVLKQFDYWLGASQDDTRRGPALRMLGAGAASLTLALAFVYYARSAYFASFMSSLGGFGQAPEQGASFVWVVGGSLLGNVIVYLTGSMWAFIMHDSDPHYVDLRVEIDDESAQMDKLTRGMDQARRREIEQLNAIHKRRTDETEAAAKRILAQQNLGWPKQLLAQFRAKDAQAVALMTSYRQSLCQALGPAARDIKFIASVDDPHLTSVTLSLTDYQRRPIVLKFI